MSIVWSSDIIIWLVTIKSALILTLSYFPILYRELLRFSIFKFFSFQLPLRTWSKIKTVKKWKLSYNIITDFQWSPCEFVFWLLLFLFLRELSAEKSLCARRWRRGELGPRSTNEKRSCCRQEVSVHTNAPEVRRLKNRRNRFVWRRGFSTIVYEMVKEGTTQ